MTARGTLRGGTGAPVAARMRGDWLTTAGVKLFQDGAIAPRTAALTEPYEAEPDNRGLLIMSQDELDQHVSDIHAAGFQACIHAIGDAAIDSALTAIERANAKLPRPDARHRIEHCGLPLPALHWRIEEACGGAVGRRGVHYIHWRS